MTPVDLILIWFSLILLAHIIPFIAIDHPRSIKIMDFINTFIFGFQIFLLSISVLISINLYLDWTGAFIHLPALLVTASNYHYIGALLANISTHN